MKSHQAHYIKEGGVLMAGKKTLDYYMALPYQEVIVAAKEGGYVGYIPELKGCITQSETFGYAGGCQGFLVGGCLGRRH